MLCFSYDGAILATALVAARCASEWSTHLAAVHAAFCEPPDGVVAVACADAPIDNKRRVRCRQQLSHRAAHSAAESPTLGTAHCAAVSAAVQAAVDSAVKTGELSLG